MKTKMEIRKRIAGLEMAFDDIKNKRSGGNPMLDISKAEKIKAGWRTLKWVLDELEEVSE